VYKVALKGQLLVTVALALWKKITLVPDWESHLDVLVKLNSIPLPAMSARNNTVKVTRLYNVDGR
jgi:hypothetical protein